MEKMLNEYLQFAKTGAEEKTKEFDLNLLLKSIVEKLDRSKISFNSDNEILYEGRKELLKRCFSNLVENALKYGNKVSISLKKLRKDLIIIIEDDGPGIPKDEYENVFKPFYKIDKSRSETRNSVGLGMSISSDITRSHGGWINLQKSEMGGLKVKVFLPF